MIHIIDKKTKKHDCKGNTIGKYGWDTCCVCGGRIHLPGCTTRKNKYMDCCEARHKMLYEQGQTMGIDDNSVPMLPY